MDFLEKVKEIKEQESKVKQLKDNLKSQLFETIVNVPYEVDKYINESFNLGFEKKVCYPILNLPRGFTKENQRFYMIPDEKKNSIIYEYVLVDKSGMKIKVVESTYLSDNITNSDYSYIFLKCWYIPIEKISYSITIENLIYKFCKYVDYNILLTQIIGDVVIYSRFNDDTSGTNYGAIIDEKFFNMVYEKTSKKFTKWLRKYGYRGLIDINLKSLLSKKETLNLKFGHKAEISVYEYTEDKEVFYNADCFNIHLYYKNCTRYAIHVQIFYKSGKLADEDYFNFVQLENGEDLKKRIFLYDILENFQRK